MTILISRNKKSPFVVFFLFFFPNVNFNLIIFASVNGYDMDFQANIWFYNLTWRSNNSEIKMGQFLSLNICLTQDH